MKTKDFVLLFKSHQIKVISLTLLIYLTLPLLLLGLVILIVVRKLMTVVAKLSDNSVHSMVSPASALAIKDSDLYGISSNNVVAWFVLNGQVSIDLIQNTILGNVIRRQDETGCMAYPQLTQFPVQHGPFIFWKWDSEFNIQSHVYLHKVNDDYQTWTDCDTLKLHKNLLRKQWARNRSLWEVIVIANYKPLDYSLLSSRELKTVVFIRFHESLGDISTWFHLFIYNLCDCEHSEGHVLSLSTYKGRHSSKNSKDSVIRSSTDDNPIKEADRRKLSWWSSLNGFLQPFKVPIHLSRQLLDPNVVQHVWHVDESRLLKRDHLKIFDAFSVQFVKDIKDTFQVSFTSVILAATASAVRSMLILLEQSIPSYVRILLPINHKCHCERDSDLCHHLVPCFVNLPVGVKSAKERLKLCHELYNELKKSDIPNSNEWIRQLIGTLPVKYISQLKKQFRFSGMLLQFPCTLDSVRMVNNRIEDVMVGFAKDFGFSISFVSYAGSIRMSLVIDHLLIPPSSGDHGDLAEDFLKNFYSELSNLSTDSIV